MCRVLFYEGRWGRKLSQKSIELALRRAMSGYCTVVGWELVQPDRDVAFEIEITVDADLDWGDAENVRDRIVERILHRFEPEYESMIEVEIDDAR